MNKEKKRRRAQIQIKILIGLLLGIIMLISSCSIAKSVLKMRSNDYDKSFDEFVQQTKILTTENTGAIISPSLSLKDDSAIIGLNPVTEREAYSVLGVNKFTDGQYTNVAVFKEAYDKLKTTLEGEELEELKRAYDKIKTDDLRKAYEENYRYQVFRNGRFGDGDFHIISHIEHSFDSTVTGQHNNMVKSGAKAIHFQRPPSCPNDEACLCLCEKPSQEETTTEYAKKLAFDPSIRTMYDRMFIVAMKLEGKYDYNPSKQRTISCKKLTCSSIGKTEFYTPIPSDSFREKSPASTKTYSTYMFENGFVIDRTGTFTPSLINRISSTPAVAIGKLSNNQLAACLRYQCFKELERDITMDAPLTKEQFDKWMEGLDEEFKEQHSMTFDEYTSRGFAVKADETRTQGVNQHLINPDIDPATPPSICDGVNDEYCSQCDNDPLPNNIDSAACLFCCTVTTTN